MNHLESNFVCLDLVSLPVGKQIDLLFEEIDACTAVHTRYVIDACNRKRSTMMGTSCWGRCALNVRLNLSQPEL